MDGDGYDTDSVDAFLKEVEWTTAPSKASIKTPLVPALSNQSTYKKRSIEEINLSDDSIIEEQEESTLEPLRKKTKQSNPFEESTLSQSFKLSSLILPSRSSSNVADMEDQWNEECPEGGARFSAKEAAFSQCLSFGQKMGLSRPFNKQQFQSNNSNLSLCNISHWFDLSKYKPKLPKQQTKKEEHLKLELLMVIDSSILSLPYGVNLLEEIRKEGYMVSYSMLPIQNSITWRKIHPEFSVEKFTSLSLDFGNNGEKGSKTAHCHPRLYSYELDVISIVIEGSEWNDYVNNEKDDELFALIQTCMQHNPGKFISLIIVDYNNKKKGSLSSIQLQRLTAKAQLSFGISSITFLQSSPTPSELAAHLCAVSRKLSSRAQEFPSMDGPFPVLSAPCDYSTPFKDSASVWQAMLASIPDVTMETAIKISSKFPSARELFDAWELRSSEIEKADTISKACAREGVSIGVSTSRSIYYHFNSSGIPSSSNASLINFVEQNGSDYAYKKVLIKE